MVTVIIPAYNYARFLPEAIDSALAQAEPGLEVEVLVVDDGSTDETPEVAARYEGRIRYLRKENAGLSAARNTGMEEAAHELVVFLDADDRLAPRGVATLLAAREELDPKPAVLAGRHLNFSSGTTSNEAPSTGGASHQVIEITALDLIMRNRFSPTVLAERSKLLALDGFDPSLRASEDRDMWIRAAAKHRVAKLEHCVVQKRDHDLNMSKAAQQQTESMLRVLGKAFANPEICLSNRERRLALAVLNYQSALMFTDAGRPRAGSLRLVKSFCWYPLPMPPTTGVGRRSRTRAVLSALWKSLKLSTSKATC